MATSWRELLDLADRLEPRLARAYLAAIARLRTRMDADAIARAISEERNYLIPAADLPLIEAALDPGIAVLNEAIRQAGELTSQRFKDELGVGMRFDLTNPLAVEVARETAAGLVTNVSAETRLALQNVIARSIRDGITYRDAAAMIRQMVGLTARDSQAVMNLRAALLELGLNRDKVRQKVQRYAAKKLRERSLTIARSGIMTASNGGQRVAWRQAASRGLLPPDTEREFLVTKDDRLCKRCQAMAGKRVPLGASFPGGNPPIHTRCRCTEMLVIKGTRRSAA